MLQSFFFFENTNLLALITTSIKKSSAPLYHLTDRCHGKSAVCNVRELEMSPLACELYVWRNV